MRAHFPPSALAWVGQRGLAAFDGPDILHSFLVLAEAFVLFCCLRCVWFGFDFGLTQTLIAQARLVPNSQFSCLSLQSSRIAEKSPYQEVMCELCSFICENHWQTQKKNSKPHGFKLFPKSNRNNLDRLLRDV